MKIQELIFNEMVWVSNHDARDGFTMETQLAVESGSTNTQKKKERLFDAANNFYRSKR